MNNNTNDIRVINTTKKMYLYHEENNATKDITFNTMYQSIKGINKRLGFNFKKEIYPLKTIKKENGNILYIVKMKYDTIHITCINAC